MTKNAIGLAGIVVAAAVSFAAAPQATTLPQVFPELVDLPETKGVVIGIGWMGLSPLSPMSAGYFLELHGDQFEGHGIFQVAKAPVVKRTVASKNVATAVRRIRLHACEARSLQASFTI